MHLSVVTCMESICEEGPGKWSPDSLRDASGLLLAITTSDFISIGIGRHQQVFGESPHL